MGAIIALDNEKGGVGKTTTGAMLACGLMYFEKLNVQIFDRDERIRNMAKWYQKEKEHLETYPEVLSMRADTKGRIITAAAQDKDITIVDGPGNDPYRASVIGVAHTLIIPLAPSGLDIDATVEIFPMIRQMHELNNETYPKVAFLITKDEPRTLLSKNIAAQLADYPYPLLETRISKRQIYAKTMSEGTSIFHMRSTDDDILAAQDEIRRLIMELKEKGYLSV